MSEAVRTGGNQPKKVLKIARELWSARHTREVLAPWQLACVLTAQVQHKRHHQGSAGLRSHLADPVSEGWMLPQKECWR